MPTVRRLLAVSDACALPQTDALVRARFAHRTHEHILRPSVGCRSLFISALTHRIRNTLPNRAQVEWYASRLDMPATVAPRNDDPSTPILGLDAFPSTGTPVHTKLQGWDLFKKLGEPRHIVAPMVDQSELAWRILSRRHGADLIYTPMISSSAFARSVQSRGPREQDLFWIAREGQEQEEGASSIGSGSNHADTDRPLVVQFAGNDPDILLQAARVVAPHCDAVDLNLGCPQHIAKRGHYGAYLQSDWQLIFRLVNKLHLELEVPVTAKMRVFDSTERTVAYAQMLERAGAQIISVHGRTREMKGHKTGLADWQKIRAVKAAVSVPVFSNGNVLFHEDVASARRITLADGVMSAEGNLYNPAIFSAAPTSPSSLYPLVPKFPFPRICALLAEYLDICESLSTPTASSAIKAHIFRLARPALEVHRDLRPILGKTGIDTKATSSKARYSQFRDFLSLLNERLAADEEDVRYLEALREEEMNAATNKDEAKENFAYIPHWLAQPYYRDTLPPHIESAEDAASRLEKRKARLAETRPAAGNRGNESSTLPDGAIDIKDTQAADEKKMSDNLAGTDVSCDNLAEQSKRIRAALGEAKEHKEKGNTFYEKRQYQEAIDSYNNALDCLPAREADRASSEDEIEPSLAKSTQEMHASLQDENAAHSDEVCQLRAIIYGNLAASHSKLGHQKETVIACNHALADDPLYIKALHRRAQANENIATWSSLSSALEDYKTMNSMPHPSALDASLQSAIRRLPPRIEQVSAAEKQEMLDKLKGIGNSMLGYFGLSTDNFQLQQGEGGGYSLNFKR